MSSVQGVTMFVFGIFGARCRPYWVLKEWIYNQEINIDNYKCEVSVTLRSIVHPKLMKN